MKNSTYFILLTLIVGCSNSIKISNQTPSHEPKITEAELLAHIKYLSDNKREGRFPGSQGSKEAIDYISKQFKTNNILPGGTKDFLQPFEFIAGIKADNDTRLVLDGKDLSLNKDFIPIEFSSNGKFEGEIAFVGYGFLINDSISWNDYKGINLDGKWALIFSGAPGGDHPHSKFRNHSALRKKAILAKDKNALGVIFVNQKGNEGLKTLKHTPNSLSIGIPVIQIKRDIANELLSQRLNDLQIKLDEQKQPQSFSIDKNIRGELKLKREIKLIPNVIGIIPGNDLKLKEEYIVLGAHFDHLGLGEQGSGSLMPGSKLIHNGADDNSSGTAALLELSSKLSKNKGLLKRSIILMGYNAEEEGLLGSKYFVNNPTVDLQSIVAMINMDMIGRMSNNAVTVGGTGTANIFESTLKEINKDHNLKLKMSPEGFGPSDHASFYINNIPVLFFFTGTHSDYHKPSDDWQRINIEGQKKITDFIYDLTLNLSRMSEKPVFKESGPKQATQARSTFKVTLGIMPSYVSDEKGLVIDGVRKNGPAGKAGIKKGDMIISIKGKEVNSIYDYMYRLEKLEPGEVVKVTIIRKGEELTLAINL
ncbi:M28 family peptidase [Candidatus Marinimicrobia bacterium]|nr:M28 family peptidase [Candidatus Neomarinimicrobiota bacterium]